MVVSRSTFRRDGFFCFWRFSLNETLLPDSENIPNGIIGVKRGESGSSPTHVGMLAVVTSAPLTAVRLTAACPSEVLHCPIEQLISMVKKEKKSIRFY